MDFQVLNDLQKVGIKLMQVVMTEKKNELYILEGYLKMALEVLSSHPGPCCCCCCYSSTDYNFLFRFNAFHFRANARTTLDPICMPMCVCVCV